MQASASVSPITFFFPHLFSYISLYFTDSDLVGVVGHVIFLQPAPLHPHIYSNDHICLVNLYRYFVSMFSTDYICLGSLVPFVISFS